MSNQGKLEHLGRTASTMLHNHTTNNFSHFKKPKRSQKRLNSTIMFKQPYHNKFSPLRQKHIDWQKWRANTFPIVWDGFTGMLKKRASNVQKQEEMKEKASHSELKLRHKIREVIRLQSDIEKAKQNNKLIEVIEDYHQNKINGFFDHLENYLNRNP